MDELIKMLMQQYKIPEAQARQYASDIHSRASTDRSKVDTAEAGALKQEDQLQRDAYGKSGERAIGDLNKLKMNFDAFTQMHEQKQRGEKLPPANEAWYQSIRKQHDDAIRANAARSMEGQSQPGLEMDPSSVQVTSLGQPAPMGQPLDPSYGQPQGPTGPAAFAERQRQYQAAMAAKRGY